jgi:hypothetical protein
MFFQNKPNKQAFDGIGFAGACAGFNQIGPGQWTVYNIKGFQLLVTLISCLVTSVFTLGME